MRNFVDETITFSLVAADTVVSKKVSVQPGQIVAMAAFFTESLFSGVVRLEVRDNLGKIISKLQNIRNYRDREAGYLEGKKPIYFNGGAEIEFIIISEKPIVTAQTIDLVLVYAETSNN